MSFPPPPTEAIDWPNLGFTIHPTAGHIQSTYTRATGWSPPRLVRSPLLPLHGLCAGLNYGQQCYEGLKAFRTSDASIHLFRPSRNAGRLAHSASFVSMPAPPEELFLTCVGMAVSLNAAFVPPASDKGAALYVRPLLFGSSPQLGLSPGDEYTFCVFVAPVGVYHGASPVAALLLESFDRAAPRGTGSAKVGGNYAPVLKHSEGARARGFGITLHVDAQTRSFIEEFSTSGFLATKRDKETGGRTLVVPKSDGIIDSITSECVQIIAEKTLGWKVEVRAVTVVELDEFEEVFAAGTAAALVPVKSIETESGSWKKEYATAEDGGPAEAVSVLLDKLRGVQTGRDEDVFGWRYPVGPVEVDEDGYMIKV